MQKKLIALAIAGLASSAAFAQSNVTIYGRMDYGFVDTNGNSGGIKAATNKHQFASGVQSGSRIGFKGAEDLGNGLKAIFETEFGIGIDQAGGASSSTTTGSSTATWTNRHSYVGLTGGFGTVVGGRLDGVRYGVFNTYDPFAGGTVGNFTQMTRQVDRADNAVAYISPNWNGFGLVLAYATNIAGAENTKNNNDQRLNTIMGTYDNGPISIKLDFERVKVQSFSGDVKVSTIGGSYDFGVVKVSALYDYLKQDVGGPTTDDKRAWLVGVKAPFGKFNAKAMYGRVQNKLVSNADANKWAIGADYALSKRTNFYADFGKIHNDGGASYSISAAANAMGMTMAAPGAAGATGNGVVSGVKGFDLGIAHNF